MASRDELYAKFGITAEASQLLETSLGTLSLSVAGLSSGWHIAPDATAARAALEKIDANTLGQILAGLKGRVGFSEELLDVLSNGLSARNRLIHGFFERHSFSIQTDEGRDAMMADLESLHDLLFTAWRHADAMAGLASEVLFEQQREQMSAGAYADLYPPSERLLHMKRSSLQIRSLIQGRSIDDLAIERTLGAAIERCLENVSEASRYVPSLWKRQADAALDWQGLMDLGDKLREPPYSPEPAVLWRLCTTDLDPLEAAIDAMIAAHGPIPRPPPRSA